ncbi:MAG TPA: LemA family protein [Clostridiales bacterium]|nr:LemA family protein [Clostridiales bacterium]
MANELDEMTGPVNSDGRDVNVIEKQIKPQLTTGTKIFEIVLWIFIIPGLIFAYLKVKAKQYLQQLQQRIQANASTIDNYLEQRVVILTNVVGLVEKATKLDKETYENIAALRSGAKQLSDDERNITASNVDSAFRSINVAVERYPELKSMAVIADAMQQNSYLQKEITAARELYNDSVARWNAAIFEWPTKLIVAARAGYTTRIPFTASAEVKQRARESFF